ncbi:two-component system regulatory protein YycI [Thermoflavimicrobium dichotomicum]|uniref:Two-component signal transduction system YycFG, regulatory protein YycI n=1 Tax=Thermoflavimicrobium dichotomicum TaxID=46223 RepID=A0A1I3K9Z5_9BACL|nr:two-component system regulatory protein YycI [Thermoflavimicrobium dichotomicum]SFI69309.1 Two-component signal transduction system YycFG, regulatory protein YycI [Thermoflavimicrobium dichotomicum]
MDWRRAKTILIIAFICLDLFLGFQLYRTMEKKSQYMNSNIIENGQVTDQEVQSLLAKYQIKLATSKPKEPTQISAFKAKASSLSGWKKGDGETYAKTFPSPVPFKDYQHMDQMLQKWIPFFKDFRYSENDSKPNVRVYLQMKDQIPIYNSRILVHLEKNKIKAIELSHYELTQPISIYLTSFNSALYHLIQSGKVPTSKSPSATVTIREVSLGYWVYPKAEEHIILPAWRFYIDHHFYYVPANKNMEVIKK